MLLLKLILVQPRSWDFYFHQKMKQDRKCNNRKEYMLHPHADHVHYRPILPALYFHHIHFYPHMEPMAVRANINSR